MSLFLSYKGWFNLEESNIEVYSFSKLRRFLSRLNFMMEDTVRNTLTRTIIDYTKSISLFCPSSIKVNSNYDVEVVGGKFPLFIVDLKFVAATSPESPAQFVYSSGIDAIFDAIFLPLDQVNRSTCVIILSLL